MPIYVVKSERNALHQTSICANESLGCALHMQKLEDSF